jgi:hypothetical protein
VKLAAFETKELALMDQNLRATFGELKVPVNAEDFKRTIARFLTGEDVAVDKRLKLDSSMIGAENAALAKAGADYGREFLELASPSSIEQAVVLAGEYGPMPFQDSKMESCWKKYCELSEAFDTADKINERIRALFRERILHALNQ